MKVGMYYNNNDVRVERMQKPRINKEEMLVKVMASGICGSDVLEEYRLKKAPLVLGHEIAGKIEKTGSKVKKYQKGDRVFVSHHVPCNTCDYCLKGHETACDTLHSTNFYPGGFTEYLKVPKINVDRGVFKLPKSISYEEGTFIEPLACVYRGQKKANVEQGDKVLVLGSGISGMLHIKLAKATGAGKITAIDINKFRLEKALEFGADEAIHSKDYTVEKFDKIFLCTSAKPAIDQALKSLEREATLEIFAVLNSNNYMDIPFNDTIFWKKQIKVLSTYAASPEDIQKSIELIKNKRVPVKDMITHRLNLEEIAKGFKLVEKAEESIKVIIYPTLKHL